MKLKKYLRDRRGSTSIECAFGTAAMIAASLLALDLYRLASAQTSSLYAAVTLADSVIRQGETETGQVLENKNKMTAFVQSLAKFLHDEQLSTSNASFVVSAVYMPEDSDNPTVLWTEKKVFYGTEDGEADEPQCSEQDKIKIEPEGGLAQLPDGFTMEPDEVVIVAKVCVERTNTTIPGTLFAHYIVPSRDLNLVVNLTEPSVEMAQVGM